MVDPTPEEVASQLAALQKIVQDQATFIAGLQAAGAGSSKGSETKKEEDRGPWAPHYRAINPHAQRSNTCSEKPQLFDLAFSPTFQTLESKVSSFKYEFRTIEPVLSYLFDTRTLLDESLPFIVKACAERRSKSAEGDDNPSEEDAEVDTHLWALAAHKNSMDKIYELLSQRGDYIRLKTKYDDSLEA